MRRALMIHPDSRCAAVTGIEADVARPRSGEMTLTYRVTGLMSGVWLPAAMRPERIDGLWRRTCFEAFVGAGSAYLEFNFAPSTQWAAYRFTGYRDGMTPAIEIVPRRIEVTADAQSFELRVTLDLPADATGRLGLSAVIEETGGGLSYWALVHLPGKPDFHHSAAFAMDLPPSDIP
jgi:hypothetical protein